MATPTVSIGLPVYNGENYLRFAIESILCQEFEDFELLISDNASQDSTRDICESYAQRDKRVRYSRCETNLGAAPNYQRVFRLATGKYFKWAAHDDVCLPGFLHKCVETMEGEPASTVLVYPRAERIDESGNVMSVDLESLASPDPRPHKRASHVMRSVNLAWAQFGLIRPEALQKTRLIDSFIGSDYLLLAELAMLGHFREISEILFQRRVHPGMSNVVHQTSREWCLWMDSSQPNHRSFCPSFVSFGLECVKSATRLPLTRMEKVLCSVTVPSVWYLRNLHDLGGRYKRKLMTAIGI